MNIIAKLNKLEEKINATEDIRIKTVLVKRGFIMFIQLFVWWLVRKEVITKNFVLSELKKNKDEIIDEITEDSIYTYEIFNLDGLNRFEICYEYKFDKNGICKKIIVG